MTNINRMRATWTGFTGGPGVSTFYGLVSGASLPDLRAFFLAIAPMLPSTVTIQVEDYGDVIEDTTGALVGSWTDSPVLPVVGSDPTQYPAPAGCVVNWLTSTVLDGHRARGRTFIVPLGGAQYQ